jgi:hypothetical protein
MLCLHPSLPISSLPILMASPPLVALLVALSGLAAPLASSHGSTLAGAVPIAVIAFPADLDLLKAPDAAVEPMGRMRGLTRPSGSATPAHRFHRADSTKLGGNPSTVNRPARARELAGGSLSKLPAAAGRSYQGMQLRRGRRHGPGCAGAQRTLEPLPPTWCHHKGVEDKCSARRR